MVFVYSMFVYGDGSRDGGRRKARRVKEYCKDYGTWRVFFFWRESIVRVFLFLFCSSCVLGWLVGTEIEFVERC